MPEDLVDHNTTLVQVMPWCRQATSRYLNQCWPGSPTPCGVTRPQWVNTVFYSRQPIAWGKIWNVFSWYKICFMFFVINSMRSGCDFKNPIFSLVLLMGIFRFFMIMPPNECHRTLLMRSPHRFMWWLSAIRQQAITWASVDPDLWHH